VDLKQGDKPKRSLKVKRDAKGNVTGYEEE
jgi:hypothetical protein